MTSGAFVSSGLSRGASFFAWPHARSINRYAARLVLSEIALTHGKAGAHYGSQSTQDVDMRFTVHAEQSRGPVEFHRATASEAITTGWELMDAGATGLYIYDDEIDAVYWPDEFAELHMITVAARPAIRGRCQSAVPTQPPMPINDLCPTR
jgi:hypothetical protein